MTRSCLKIILENARIVFLSFEYCISNPHSGLAYRNVRYAGARRFQAWTKVAKQHLWAIYRVSVQGVKSLGGHFACRGVEFYEVKKKVVIFQQENGNTFTLFIILIVKSVQKEQNSTNLLL